MDPKHKVSMCLSEKWTKLMRKVNKMNRQDNTVYTGLSGIALLKLKMAGYNDKKTLQVILQVTS